MVSRFPEVIISGDEHMINSVFTDDHGRHLFCNPHKNAYHCWKSSKSGNLVHFVSLIDGISHAEAAEILDAFNIRTLENKLREMLGKNKPKQVLFRKNVVLPPDTVKITDLEDNLKFKITSYLSSRKLPADDLYFCRSGKYRNRVIIPYLSPDNDFFYWNGRLFSGEGMRYRGPDKKEFGVGKGDVLYTRKWCKKGSQVYLTEGEFDAMTLDLCGFNSFACGGKEVTDEQLKYLRDYKVCLAFDRDSAGWKGVERAFEKMGKKGFSDISFVQPPVGYKDWNAVVEKNSFDELREYVDRHRQKLNTLTLIRLRLSKSAEM